MSNIKLTINESNNASPKEVLKKFICIIICDRAWEINRDYVHTKFDHITFLDFKPFHRESNAIHRISIS